MRSGSIFKGYHVPCRVCSSPGRVCSSLAHTILMRRAMLHALKHIGSALEPSVKIKYDF
jgi:hypothetical protein